MTDEPIDETNRVYLTNTPYAPGPRVCEKCGKEIRVSNAEHAAQWGPCWHTVADDEPLCDVGEGEDWEHRPLVVT